MLLLPIQKNIKGLPVTVGGSVAEWLACWTWAQKGLAVLFPLMGIEIGMEIIYFHSEK